MRILITGSAGFIGYHLAARLLAEGHQVHGFDAMTDYYDIRLKQARHARLRQSAGFTATEARLEDMAALQAAAAACAPDMIVHLAAQAGYAIRSTIRAPISRPISLAVSTSPKWRASRVSGIC